MEIIEGDKDKKELIDANYISEADILNWGHMIYKKIWNMFELDEVMDRIQHETKAQFSIKDACFLMVIQHLLNPLSKRGAYTNQHKYLNMPRISLQHLYRTLDVLCDYKELLEEEIFYKNFHLFNMRVDVVFYDVTTFYFESVRADNLKNFGFSKDGKFKEVQVVMGLLVDCEGRPIGYELFSGNTFDGKTLDATLDKLKKRFSINKVVIVADRGINSKVNLKSIKDKGYGYIFASRIKNMPETIEEEIFDQAGYVSSGGDGFRYKVIDYKNKVKCDNRFETLDEKLIVTYSPERANKDSADRQRLIEKASNYLEKQSLIDASFKRGGRKYISKINQMILYILWMKMQYKEMRCLMGTMVSRQVKVTLVPKRL